MLLCWLLFIPFIGGLACWATSRGRDNAGLARVIAFLSMAAVFVPAVVVWFIGNAFYLKLDLRLGAVMALITAAMVYLAQPIAMMTTSLWLSISIGIFVGGWILQFIGHHYEGKKPAFVDDIMGLAIGPLFVLAELSFELGLRNKLKSDIEDVSGPVH